MMSADLNKVAPINVNIFEGIKLINVFIIESEFQNRRSSSPSGL